MGKNDSLTGVPDGKVKDMRSVGSKDAEDEIQIVLDVITLSDDDDDDKSHAEDDLEFVCRRKSSKASTKSPKLTMVPLVVRHPPKENTKVFALQTKANHSCYVYCQFFKQNQTLAKVKLDSGEEKEITSNNVAYDELVQFKLTKVGMRIIGKINTLKNCPITNFPSCYLPGIIAGFRSVEHVDDKYFVLFDNGEAAYIASDDIRLMWTGNEEDFFHQRRTFYPETIDFIRDFVGRNGADCQWSLPRKYNKGGIVTVWRDGKWRIARVNWNEDQVQVVRVMFEDSGEVEHILKASPRFFYVYKNDYDSRGKVKNEEGLDSCMGFEGTIQTINKDDSTLDSVSPLARPLFSGWKYEDFDDITCNAKIPPRGYTPPGGETGNTLRQMNQLIKHLDEIDSQLQSNWFCLHRKISCFRVFKPDNVRRKIKDISYGKEPVPVECVNSVDEETLPDDFEYEVKCTYSSAVNVVDGEPFLTCCDCTDGCMEKTKCACWKRTMEGLADLHLTEHEQLKRGYHHRKLDEELANGIYECNHGCKCKKETCTNRVVQNGLQWPLQIFRTKMKGWSVRALCDIPKGSFVSTYAGHIITDSEADMVGSDDTYYCEISLLKNMTRRKPEYESDVSDIEDDFSSLTLSLSDEKKASKKRKSSDLGEKTLESRCSKFSRKQAERIHLFPAGRDFVINPLTRGNIGRFYSHSCDPNMFVQNVFVNTPDLRYPEVAFFTKKDVLAGSELTWHYGYSIGSVPDKSIICRCGVSKCQGQLL